MQTCVFGRLKIPVTVMTFANVIKMCKTEKTWMDRLGYGLVGPGPLVSVTDQRGEFKLFASRDDVDEICERYNRGIPEPPYQEET